MYIYNVYIYIHSLFFPMKLLKNVLRHVGDKQSKIKYFNYHIVNPLTPRRTQVSPFTEISILF